jgi:hypothetical protein
MRCNRLLLSAVLATLTLGPLGGTAEAPDTSADEETLRDAKIGTDGPALLEFFRKRTVSDTERDKIRMYIRQLGDDAFEVREKASSALIAIGKPAEKYLREATQSADLEVSRRAGECLRAILESGPSTALPAAAARLIAKHKPAGAAEVLLAYLVSADNIMGADDVRNALATLALRDGQPGKVLVDAVADKAAVRRAAAGEALVRAGLAAKVPAVRKLLQDPETAVRLRVGLALAFAKDKEAFPVLIDLFAQLPPDQLWAAEDLLCRLAEDKAPTVSLGTDEASRQKCRDAWAAWWRDNGARVNLAKLDAAPRLLGYTLIALLDQGQVQELDNDKKVRWSVGGLDFPLDVQLLPGDRLLVAEHGGDGGNSGNRVTERNLKGQILWEKKIAQPLVAQRLANGNTFIAARYQMVEVDKAGKEVFTHSFANGDLVMRAQKLANGDIGVVTTSVQGTRRFQRLSPEGKELASFPVDVYTSGGRIDVLPNGHVLVPVFQQNKVVEYNAEGKQVWEVAIPEPITAVRLPNGNTLITSMSEKRAVQLDRAGKEVWEYKSATRVTRAYRR